MEGSTLIVDGIALFFAAAGAGLPVLYVHGNTASSLWYSRVMEIPGLRTTALDLPNFGRSDPLPGPVEIERYAEVLAGFIEASGLDRPLLVGHSLGGAVAMALAEKRPGLVRALVLVDSAPPSGFKTPAERHPAIELMRTNPQVLAAALRAVVPTLADEAFFAQLVEEARLMAAPAWIGNAEALSRFRLPKVPADFDKPVLVLWGDRDVIVTEAMARETAEAFPKARLEKLEGLGHGPMAENPAAFARVIAAFAASLK